MTVTNDSARFDEIHDAVSHGAIEHEPGIADDMMFLCERIAELEAQLKTAQIACDRAEGQFDKFAEIIESMSAKAIKRDRRIGELKQENQSRKVAVGQLTNELMGDDE